MAAQWQEQLLKLEKMQISLCLKEQTDRPQVARETCVSTSADVCETCAEKRCYNCCQLGHIAKDCPKMNDVSKFISAKT
jgi:hypothetical protein